MVTIGNMPIAKRETDDDLEDWLKARVPPEMAPNLQRGMQTARFTRSKKDDMVAAADAFLASHPSSSP